MTDNGQGLALKGADEVGDAPEDNTMVAIQEGRARASASELENAETGVQQSPAQRLAVAASSLMQRATGTTPKAEGGKARATPATKPIEGATSNEEVMVQLRAMQEQLRAETEKSAALEKKLAHAEREAEQKKQMHAMAMAANKTDSRQVFLGKAENDDQSDVQSVTGSVRSDASKQAIDAAGKLKIKELSSTEIADNKTDLRGSHVAEWLPLVQDLLGNRHQAVEELFNMGEACARGTMDLSVEERRRRVLALEHGKEADLYLVLIVNSNNRTTVDVVNRTITTIELVNRTLSRVRYRPC